MHDRSVPAHPPLFAFPILAAATLISLVSSGHARGEEEAWKTCSTPKAQFALQIPASLIHSTAPTATGCSFQTPNSEFTVEAVTQTEAAVEGETLESRMQKEVNLLAGTVAHKKKGDDWFVLSGVTPDGTEYYRKLFTNGSQWVTLRITFPHTRNKKYERWVKQIDKNFVPFVATEERRGD